MRRLPDAVDLADAKDVAALPPRLRPRTEPGFPAGRPPGGHDGFAARMFAAARTDDGAPSDRGLGWKTSLVLNLLLLIGPTGLAIALPPVLECRARAERFGFFAGETAGACAERGVRMRLKRLDDRIKMLVRGSGA